METKNDFNDRLLSLGLARVSEAAAIAAIKHIGAGNEKAADQAAVDAMRNELNKIEMNGKIVIGEGELDEAPMLYIGENVGTKNGPALDIAVDPLEGTNFVANNLPGALSVIAIANKSNLFGAPETYMNKISANCSDSDVIDLDFSVKKNIYNLAEFKNKNVLGAGFVINLPELGGLEKLQGIGIKSKYLIEF